MISSNAKLHEMCKIVMGFPPAAGGSGEDYVSLKGYDRLTIVLVADNATTVTGSAVTFKQGLNVAGGTEIALAFPSVWHSNIDTGASDTLIAQTGTSLTTDATNAKNLMYIFSFEQTDLSLDLDYTSVRIDLTAATASILSAIYFLYPTHNAQALGGPSAIVD